MSDANADAVRALIADAISNPKVRAAFYENPLAVANKYGLASPEGEAMLTLRNSLVSALGQEQIEALNELLIGKMYGGKPGGPDGGTDGCNPHRKCAPSGCSPGCNPDATR